MGHARVQSISIAKRSCPGNSAVAEHLSPERSRVGAVPPARHALMIEDDHPRTRVSRSPEADREQARLDWTQFLEPPARKVRRQAPHLVGTAIAPADHDDREVF